MKVTVTKKVPNAQPLVIHTEFIKLQDAMKYANIVYSGGEAKQILDGAVKVNGEVCLMRGKKLYPNDTFSFQGYAFVIENDT